MYGLLHHPVYRSRYADNLKRELPRIPYAPDFRTFSDSGKKLADLHLNYEDVKGYRLTWDEKDTLNYRVEKMKPGKKSVPESAPDYLCDDGGQPTYKIFELLKYNETLTLSGIPESAFAYWRSNRGCFDYPDD